MKLFSSNAMLDVCFDHIRFEENSVSGTLAIARMLSVSIFLVMSLI